MNKNVFLLSAVVIGGILSACSSSTRAPITSVDGGSRASVTGSTIAGNYVVQRGDTLYSIARRSGTSVQQLMSLNGISNPLQLEVGQSLRLGAGSVASSTTSPTPPSVPSAPSQSASSYTPRAADAGQLAWTWPVRGRIISGFSSSTRGIDIAGPLNTPVLAASNGVVSYVGNGLRGLGNLVLITHANGFISAYAHNSRIVVSNNQRVTKGQKIAELGQSDTTSPRLHFEIRRHGTPVNPLSYLPR